MDLNSEGARTRAKQAHAGNRVCRSAAVKGSGTRAEGDGGDRVADGGVTVIEGVGWMPWSFVPMKDVA